MPRLLSHTREPAFDAGRHGEAHRGRRLCVTEKCDVCDRVALADEERPLRKVLAHYVEGRLAPRGYSRAHLSREILEAAPVGPEFENGDVRLVTILLEKKPLKRLRSAQSIRGQVRGSVGQVIQNGIRLSQAGAVVEFEHRDATIGILGQELRFARLRRIGEDVEIFDIVCDAEVAQQ